MQVLWVHCDKSHNAATVSVLNKHSTGEESEAVSGTVKVSRRNSSFEKRKGQIEIVETIVLASLDRPCLKHNSLKTSHCKVHWEGAELIYCIHWYIPRNCPGSEVLVDVQQSGWDLHHFWPEILGSVFPRAFHEVACAHVWCVQTPLKKKGSWECCDDLSCVISSIQHLGVSKECI